MNINNYEQHVDATKNLKMSDSFYKAREPYKESFEKIYNQAKQENVSISNAKDFLNSLSKEELSTLQNYTLLVDDINISQLDNEGAYNLLLHHYEKYDFNQDGLITNGIGKSTSLLPINMPNHEKEILVQTLNEMPEKERFISMLMINPPKFKIQSDGTISAKENNTYMDYESIKNRIDRILNPLPGEYSSPEFKNTMKIFLNMFENNLENKVKQNEYENQQLNNEAQINKAKFSNQKTIYLINDIRKDHNF